MDAIGRNLPPSERGRRMTYAEVRRVALCKGWLVTVDERTDVNYSEEANLKFWKYDENSKRY